MIGIRYFEPIDITVARRLAGWPLSPKEKRILIASARNPAQHQLADALGITVNTLKSYNNEMVSRLGVESRHSRISALLSDQAARHDIRLENKGNSEHATYRVVGQLRSLAARRIGSHPVKTSQSSQASLAPWRRTAPCPCLRDSWRPQHRPFPAPRSCPRPCPSPRR